MRRPWLTTEFWVMIATVLATTFKLVDFPIEAIGLIATWILSRVVVKAVEAKKPSS